MDQLLRFRDAQDHPQAGFRVAMDELRAGRKRSHWIWYVFPQIVGMGSSDLSRHFGVRGRQEAEAYLRDDLLRGRLLEAVGVVAGHMGRADRPRLEALMGSRVDALKLVSSLTLFEVVAGDLSRREHDPAMARLAAQAHEILAVADTQGYARCDFTLQQLDSA